MVSGQQGISTGGRMLNAYKRSDRGTWTYRFTRTGEPQAYTKGGYHTRKEALAAGRAHLNRLELGEEAGRGEVIITVEALFERYEEHCLKSNQSKDWCYSKKASFRKHFSRLVVLPARSISQQQLQECVNEAVGIGTYMRGELVKIAKAFFGWSYRSGHIPSNPSVGLQKPQGHKHHPTSWRTKEFPAEEDIAAVQAVATEDECDQLLVGQHTGSEPASLARIVWRDVDFDRHEIKISRKKNRSGSLRYHTVPLTDAAFACLRGRFGTGRPQDELVFLKIITEMRWKVLLKKASVRAGRDIAFGRACFKHMFRTALANNRKLSVPQIEAATGCSWDTLSKHYVKADTQSLHEAIREMFEGAESGANRPSTVREPINRYAGDTRIRASLSVATEAVQVLCLDTAYRSRIAA